MTPEQLAELEIHLAAGLDAATAMAAAERELAAPAEQERPRDSDHSCRHLRRGVLAAAEIEKAVVDRRRPRLKSPIGAGLAIG